MTYWNGLGMLAGAGVLIGIACAAERRAPRVAARAGLRAGRPVRSRLLPDAVARGVRRGRRRPRRARAGPAARGDGDRGALRARAGRARWRVAVQALAEVKAAPVFPRSPQTSQGEVMAALVAGRLAGRGRRVLRPRPHRLTAPPGWRPSFRVASAAAVAVTGLALAAAVGISYASEQSEEVADLRVAAQRGEDLPRAVLGRRPRLVRRPSARRRRVRVVPGRVAARERGPARGVRRPLALLRDARRARDRRRGPARAVPRRRSASASSATRADRRTIRCCPPPPPCWPPTPCTSESTGTGSCRA